MCAQVAILFNVVINYQEPPPQHGAQGAEAALL